MKFKALGLRTSESADVRIVYFDFECWIGLDWTVRQVRDYALEAAIRWNKEKYGKAPSFVSFGSMELDLNETGRMMARIRANLVQPPNG